ncbi:capsular exopolysaccharide family [Bryocella elongata]|uniref:non-specific protein-tyrosine kinase n=1 Tax=Bryocella elongata TaxID=863522 RepID=A0A1H5Z7N3_9BACT|nr:polysaccharide biosynthesis tyrosine autokinase [Bryocella elongata]SEG32134.1 capsular exopolysaccharide family [Bryocella elongata]
MIPVRAQTSQASESEVVMPQAMQDRASGDTTLSDAWLTIRKRKYWILAAALIGILLALYQSATQPRLFEAYGNIEIRSGASNEYKIGAATGGSGIESSSAHLPTQVSILKSDTLLLTVARDLDLANNPWFLGTQKSKQAQPHRNIDDPVVRQMVLYTLRADVNVSVIAKTDLIHISCQTFSADLSAEIVNKLIREYIFRSLESSAEAQKRVSDFLSTQLGDLKQQVETSQEQMIDLQKKIGILGFDPTHNEITTSLEDLNRAVGQAQISRIMAEVRYHTLSGMDPNQIDDSVASTQVGSSGNLTSGAPGAGDQQLATLRTQMETTKADLAKLNVAMGDRNPQIRALRAQVDTLNQEIRAEQDRILAQARQNYIASRTNEQQTRGALEAEKSTAYQLRDQMVQYTLRQREYETNRQLYDGLLQRLRSAAVEAGLESTEIEIVDNAVPPVYPTLKPRSTILMIDLVVALIVGLIVAFVLDSLDTGLRDVMEIERITGLPSLAVIPKTRRTSAEQNATGLVARNIGVLAAPKSQFAESFRGLRTSLLLATAGKEPKVVLVTSSTPSEGKTTVSTNLATVLAQRDVKTLLIDADLRRPTVHHRFGLNGKIGLSSVLTGSATLEQALQRVPELPNLDVLVSGPVPPFPTEMLSSQVMRNLVEQCRGIYTHIVIDSPPLLSVTDSIVLAPEVDTVVLVVRHGKSGKQAVRRARDLLIRSGAPLAGIALNAVDLNSPEYYSYYGYYGYSGYGSQGVEHDGWASKSDKRKSKSKEERGGE